MQPELQRYYEDRFTMCSTQGWKDLMDDVEKMKASYDTLSNIPSTEEFWQRKGYVEMLSWLLNLKKVSEEVYEDLKHEETV